MARTAQPKSIAITHRLNLHDTYGIAWTEEMIARDVMQNFYDASPVAKFAEVVKVQANREYGLVEIKSPAEFDAQLLWRIGVGTKTGRPDLYAGEFGEGFAMAVLQAMRNSPSCSLFIEVGRCKAAFRLENVSVGGMAVRELVCDVTERKSGEGTRFVLKGVSPTLVEAFEQGYDFFFHPHHPIVGDLLSPSVSGSEPPPVALYRSTMLKRGAIFYRRQLRAHLDVPYIFCHHDNHPKIKTDRDRLNLNRHEVNHVMEACARNLDAGTIRSLVLEEFKPFWASGHPMLKALARAWSKLPGAGTINFPAEYCARANNWMVNHTAKALGKIVCMQYMTLFGMPTDKDVAEAEKTGRIRQPAGIRVEDLLSATGVGCPREDAATGVLINEEESFEILRRAYMSVTQKPLDGHQFLVFEPTEAIPKLENFNRPMTICLSKTLLEGEFGAAYAAFTYEADRKYTHGQEAVFTDLLTDRLEQTIAHRKTLVEYGKRWEQRRLAGAFDSRPESYASAIRQLTRAAQPVANRCSVILEIAARGLATVGWKVDTYPFTSGKPSAEMSAVEREAVAELFSAWSNALEEEQQGLKLAEAKESVRSRRRSALLTAAAIAPDEIAPYLNLTFLCLYGGATFTGDIRNAFEEGLRRHKDSEFFNVAYGQALYSAGEYEQALERFDRAVELAGRWADAYIHRALCHIALDRLGGALANLRAGANAVLGEAGLDEAEDDFEMELDDRQTEQMMLVIWLEEHIRGGCDDDSLPSKLAHLFVAFYNLCPLVAECRSGMEIALKKLRGRVKSSRRCLSLINDALFCLAAWSDMAEAHFEAVEEYAVYGLRALAAGKEGIFEHVVYIRGGE